MSCGNLSRNKVFCVQNNKAYLNSLYNELLLTLISNKYLCVCKRSKAKINFNLLPPLLFLIRVQYEKNILSVKISDCVMYLDRKCSVMCCKDLNTKRRAILMLLHS